MSHIGTLSALPLLHLARLDQSATEAALQSRQGVLQGLILVDRDPGWTSGVRPRPWRTGWDPAGLVKLVQLPPPAIQQTTACSFPQVSSCLRQNVAL